jgi:wobble nucleotide-excising tRNase
MPKIQNFKKINSGSFRNYTHNALTANLSSYLNIFLGWNGSGKTTLSRIMRSYELNKLYDNLYQFEIVLDDKSTVTQHDTEKLHQSVKVFNDHYVDSILRDGM